MHIFLITLQCGRHSLSESRILPPLPPTQSAVLVLNSVHCCKSSSVERTSAEMQHLSGSRTCTCTLMHVDTRRRIKLHSARRHCCHCAYTICTWHRISRSHLLTTLASFTGQEKRSAAILKMLPFMQCAMHSVQRAARSTVGGVGRVTLHLFLISFQ